MWKYDRHPQSQNHIIIVLSSEEDQVTNIVITCISLHSGVSAIESLSLHIMVSCKVLLQSIHVYLDYGRADLSANCSKTIEL